MQYSFSQDHVSFSYEGDQNWLVKPEALETAIF